MIFSSPSLEEAELAVLEQINQAKQALRYQLHEPRRWTGSLRRLAFARNMQGSNSIEGYHATLDDAAAIAMGEQPQQTSTDTHEALVGYRNAMTYVLQLAQEPPITVSEELLSSLHFMITGHDVSVRPGRWRHGSIFVSNANGERVHEGAPVEEVPALMAELVSSIASARLAGENPLVNAAMAHLNLVMIHPFRDGNGRMARCLQSVVLADSGVLSPVFLSIEEYLGARTQAYYDVLGKVGGGSWQPQRDARAWVRFCLTAHLRQADTLRRRIRESERLWRELEHLCTTHGLQERQLAVLHDAALGLRIRNATYRAIITDSDLNVTLSDQTVSRDLRQLTTLGLLVAHGSTRGRYYLAGQPLLTAREACAETATEAADPFA